MRLNAYFSILLSRRHTARPQLLAATIERIKSSHNGCEPATITSGHPLAAPLPGTLKVVKSVLSSFLIPHGYSISPIQNKIRQYVHSVRYFVPVKKKSAHHGGASLLHATTTTTPPLSSSSSPPSSPPSPPSSPPTTTTTTTPHNNKKEVTCHHTGF